MKRQTQRVIYRGPAATLVIDAETLERGGPPVALTGEQIARLEADPTVAIELVDAQPSTATQQKED